MRYRVRLLVDRDPSTALPLVPPPAMGTIFTLVGGEVISYEGDEPYIELELAPVAGCPFQGQWLQRASVEAALRRVADRHDAAAVILLGEAWQEIQG